MSVLGIILLVIAVIIAILAIGGAIAARRRARENAERFDAQLATVNRQLADARAQDRGWEREALEAAARQAFAMKKGAAQIDAMYLTQVIDKPGIEEDQAVFTIESGQVRHELRLGRRGGAWSLESLSG